MLIIHYVSYVILNKLNTRHSIDYHNHGHSGNIFIRKIRERTFRGIAFSMNKEEIYFVSLLFSFFSFPCVNLFPLNLHYVKTASFVSR
jgi:hypothetical protein